MKPLIVVCGPTATGKTAVGVELCRILGGEVISADSMQIYKDLSICTAKPDISEMKGIPHHLIDILPPDRSFSVAEYASLARKTADGIYARGHIPVVVGGTGLYISALIDNIDFSHVSGDSSLRSQLESESAQIGAEEMHKRLAALDPEAAKVIHPNNVIRVIRAIEMNMISGRTVSENKELSRRTPSPYKLCMIGLNTADRAVLYERTDRRVDKMMEMGMVDEVRRVYERYRTKTAFNAIGYKEMIPYIEGKCTLDEAIDRIKQGTRNYAKRQLTWFRRDARISWVDVTEIVQIDGIIKNCMNIVEKSELM